jgi:hypothetical protein
VLIVNIAIWGLPGYTFKGIYKELQKRFGSSVQNYIIAARTSQGYEDWKVSSADERREIIGHFLELQSKTKLHKSTEPESYVEDDHDTSPHGFQQTRHMTFDERKKLAEQKKKSEKEKSGPGRAGALSQIFHKRSLSRSRSRDRKGSHTPTATAPIKDAISPQFEEAIQKSVESTSRGNPEEDRRIERALRASVSELQTGIAGESDRDAIDRAIRASALSASNDQRESAPGTSDGTQDLEEQRSLEEALQRSMAEYHISSQSDGISDHQPIIMIDDQDEINKALEDSRPATTEGVGPKLPPRSADSDDDLNRALTESDQLHAEHQKSMTEEEIVLEYVKKQSLAEEQHRAALRKGSGSSLKETTAVEDDDDDEELKLAIQESLKSNEAQVGN